MKKESLTYGIIGLLVGVIIAGFTAGQAVNRNYSGMMRMMGMNMDHMNTDDHDSMDRMMNDLKSKTGDDFDKAFLQQMIEHHENAIESANLAATRAKHDEIKELSTEIISAQTKEINSMKQWQKNWGYSTTATPSTMMHDRH